MRSLFVISVSALALSACATKPLPPAISYDPDDFKPAVIDQEPAKPVEIVEVPKVPPLPGQLQPESGEVTEDTPNSTPTGVPSCARSNAQPLCVSPASTTRLASAASAASNTRLRAAG